MQLRLCHPAGIVVRQVVWHPKIVHVLCTQTRDEDDSPVKLPRNTLGATIRRKRQQLAVQLDDIGQEGLAERLEGGLQIPASPAHRLAQLVEDIRFKKGRPVLIFEIWRPSPASSSAELAELASTLATCGVDALAIGTDAEDSSNGLADLFTVCRAVKVPVLMRDWILHPLQALEAKEAGAAGVLGVVASVTGVSSALISSYSAALGIDTPIEVVSASEMEQLSNLGVPMYAMNVAVGISLALPGFSRDIAEGLLRMLPGGAVSVVGVKTLHDAIQAGEAGADVLLIKKEWLAAVLKGEQPSQLGREASLTVGGTSIDKSTTSEGRNEEDANSLSSIDTSTDALRRKRAALEQLTLDTGVSSANPPVRRSSLSMQQKQALANFITNLQYHTSGDR